MDVIYVSCVSSRKKFKKLFEGKKNIPGQQVQNYHRMLKEGFVLNHKNVVSITALPITSKNTNKKVVIEENDVENGVSYIYLPIINIRILKNILIIIKSFFKTIKLLRKNKKATLICDVLNFSVSFGALFAAKLMRRNSVGIVTDVPTKLSSKSNGLRQKINLYLIKKFKSFVFLTKDMNEYINHKNRPFVIIEGQTNIKMQQKDNLITEKYSKKVCMYAGSIKKIYGIKNLVDAFILSSNKNQELHIYGDGDYKEELIETCKKHLNIKYFGVVMNDEIIIEEQKATLLINPRPTDQEYTKYSFPSKNLEYMSSGTPLLTTKLPGMPKEYENYIYIIDDESVEGISNSLKKNYVN